MTSNYVATIPLDVPRLGRHFLAKHPRHNSHVITPPSTPSPGPWVFGCSCGEDFTVSAVDIERGFYEADAAGQDAVNAFLAAIGPEKKETE